MVSRAPGQRYEMYCVGLLFCSEAATLSKAAKTDSSNEECRRVCNEKTATLPAFTEGVEHNGSVKENLRCTVLKGPGPEIWEPRHAGDHRGKVGSKPGPDSKPKSPQARLVSSNGSERLKSKLRARMDRAHSMCKSARSRMAVGP